MKVLAVDPGRRSAWALGDGPNLLLYGRTRETKTYGELSCAAKEVFSDIEEKHGVPRLVVVEGQWIPRGKNAQAASALVTARCAQIWAERARYMGASWVLDDLPPSRWQKELGVGPKEPRQVIKWMSMKRATMLFSGRIQPPKHILPARARKTFMSQDEADAICMWHWAWGWWKSGMPK